MIKLVNGRLSDESQSNMSSSISLLNWVIFSSCQVSDHWSYPTPLPKVF